MAAAKEQWGSRIGLILAMAGNAVGLGNFLRFPVQAVQNGGGAFMIPYLVSFLLMGIPLLWVEWAMGRYGGKFGDHSTPFILDNMTHQRFWKYFGVFGIFTNIGVMAYYTYIESWTLTYAIKSIKGDFLGMPLNEVGATFDRYVDLGSSINLPIWAIVAYLITLIINIYILSRGLSGGVEKVAKFGMPLLLIFGFFLAIRGITLGSTGRCPDCNSHLGLDFLWRPEFSSLADPKVWLAAAGQIFFTLSVGMGTIQCYASYVRQKDDIALNAMSAGWMNSFVEVVLGASVVIPIAVGYFGLDWVKENAGFMMAFKSMPFLFDQFGPVLAVLSGLAWFGLLFFAGITSSLAMGTPWMGFMEDEFKWSRNKAALSLGVVILVLSLPTILFFGKGVFDEYDYWTGTVALVLFALAEVVLFGWVFGMDKGWAEITSGADMKVPRLYRPIIKYVTPLFILVIFLTSVFKPLNGGLDDWGKGFAQLGAGQGWPWAKDSIVNQLFHLDTGIVWFEQGIPTNMFYIDMSRFLLVFTFIGLGALVAIASRKRRQNA
ncbi:sodium:calcium symporter [bacterium]|nr:sodium:calcium symporter [bacterium]